MLKTKKFKTILLSGAVIGLLIFFHFLKILNPIENSIINFLNPFSSQAYKMSSDIKSSINEQTTKRDYFAENQELKKEIERLAVENSKTKLLFEENEKLRQSLRFFTQNEYNYVLANVLSQGSNDSLESQKRKIIINKGAKDGVIAGLSVVDSEGVVIGKTISVEDKISEVSLMTDGDCKLASYIQGQSTSTLANVSTTGIVQGELGLTAKVNFIPQTEIISEGDMAITSGLEKNIPRGLVIGKVTKVNKSNNEVWQSAIIEPITDLNNLTIVSVLLP